MSCVRKNEHVRSSVHAWHETSEWMKASVTGSLNINYSFFMSCMNHDKWHMTRCIRVKESLCDRFIEHELLVLHVMHESWHVIHDTWQITFYVISAFRARINLKIELFTREFLLCLQECILLPKIVIKQVTNTAYQSIETIGLANAVFNWCWCNYQCVSKQLQMIPCALDIPIRKHFCCILWGWVFALL
jgi:hypothetical protein